MIVGVVANYFHLDPIKGLIYSAIANGLVAPIVLFFIVKTSSNKAVMGEHKNHKLIAGIGWFITILMTLAGIAAIASMFL